MRGKSGPHKYNFLAFALSPYPDSRTKKIEVFGRDAWILGACTTRDDSNARYVQCVRVCVCVHRVHTDLELGVETRLCLFST